MLFSNAEHYCAVREALVSWSELWQNSIFHRYAEMERLIPESWFHFGATEDLSNQFAVGQGEGCARAPETLLNWIHQIRSLCVLPQVAETRVLPTTLCRGLTPKKRHEIEALLSLFTTKDFSASHCLDIGGGVGHLARHLALELGCTVDSIDRDSALQEKGLAILKAWPWRDVLKEQQIRYIPGEFPRENIGDARSDNTWAIGLHTCGDLAWAQLDLLKKGYSILNIGCCYEKLNAASGTQRSSVARQRPLAWTDEALFLANRGGVERSKDEFIFQQRVQQYRFSLHELLYREGCDAHQCEEVGTATPAAYLGTFADYVRDRMRHFERTPAKLQSCSDASYRDFYRSIESLIEKKRFIAFVRNLLARPLEIALLLDRALFIEEEGPNHGRNVRLIQVFNPMISPRNIALVAQAVPVRN